MTGAKIIELVEYQTKDVPFSDLPEALGQAIHDKHAKQIDIQAPSLFTGNQWQLTSQGWVGQIPLAADLQLRLQPKTSLRNLFGMFEYAYRLRKFHFLPGLVAAASLDEFYSQLASVLARRVIDRGRQGFYRTYRTEDDQFPYIRGRVDMVQAAAKPWQVNLACQYQDHTADVDENRILAWTLWRVLRTGLCRDTAVHTVRQAFRTIKSVTTVTPYSPDECIGRLYHRLNLDYQPLHALSRFFLENSGPSHAAGDRAMLPFLVNMADLFELFVAEWLRLHLPKRWLLKAQENLVLDSAGRYCFVPDLVIYDQQTNRAHCVLDTKYKVPEQPSADDVTQVIAYAHLKQSPVAVLVFPALLANPLDSTNYGIHIRSATFDLSGELEEAGRTFLASLALPA